MIFLRYGLIGSGRAEIGSWTNGQGIRRGPGMTLEQYPQGTVAGLVVQSNTAADAQRLYQPPFLEILKNWLDEAVSNLMRL